MEKDKIKEALNLWNKKYKLNVESRTADKKNKPDWAEIFSAIYAFKYVVDVIDKENYKLVKAEYIYTRKKLLVADEEGEEPTEKEFIIAEEKITKIKKLADEWAHLDDIHLLQDQIKNLQMTKDDVFVMRYINYMGFINRIILEYGKED